MWGPAVCSPVSSCIHYLPPAFFSYPQYSLVNTYCFVQLCVYLIFRRFLREHSTVIRGVYTHVLKLPCHVWDCCIDNLDHTKFVNNTKVINDSRKDPKSTGQGDRQSIQDPCVKVAEAVGRGPSGITNCLLPPTTNIQNRRQPNSMSCKSVRTLMLTDISKF